MSVNETPSPGPRWVFGYRNPMWWIAPFNMTILVVVAVALLPVSLVGGEPPIGFTLFWVGAVAWNAYWFLFRIGYQVEVDGQVVTWRTPLRRRTADLNRLTGVGSLWMGFSRLTVDGERSLFMMTLGPGWVTFLQALAQAHPTATFPPTALDRLGARWPGAGWFGPGYYRRLV